jgi:hypothetical protein
MFKRENLSAVQLKDFSFNIRFLANYVQSDDFCFFSSRKRRIKNSLSPYPFLSINHTTRVSRLACPGLDPGTRSYNWGGRKTIKKKPLSSIPEERDSKLFCHAEFISASRFFFLSFPKTIVSNGSERAQEPVTPG